MNHIVLIGRTTRDVELRYTPNGIAVGTFNLAVDRDRAPNQQGEKETDFIRIVTWQKQAEVCANYLKKGRLVAIEGRLQIRNYETQDGQKRSAAEVVAKRVQFLERKSEETSIPHVPEEDISGINLDDLPF